MPIIVDGIEIEGDPTVETNLWKGGSSEEYAEKLAHRIRGFGFLVEIVPGTTVEGYTLLMIGDKQHSRLVALSQTRGVIQLLPDGGTVPTLDQRHRLYRGMTFMRLIGEGRKGIAAKISLYNHPNCRLVNYRLQTPISRGSQLQH